MPVSFSPDGKLIAAGGQGPIYIWETSTDQRLLTLKSPEVTSLAFSDDSKSVALGSIDGVVRLWDTTTARCLDTSMNFRNIVISIKVHSTNPLIFRIQEIGGEIRHWTPTLPSFVSTSGDLEALSPRLNHVDNQSYHYYGIEDHAILATRGERHKPILICWLPPSFEIRGSDLHENMMVVGGESGEVLIIKLPIFAFP